MVFGGDKKTGSNLDAGQQRRYDRQGWPKLAPSTAANLRRIVWGYLRWILDFFGGGMRSSFQLPMWSLMVLPSQLFDMHIRLNEFNKDF